MGTIFRSGMKNKKIVILSGAGISAESGIKTFRDSDGLWENYNVMDVATIEAYERNPELVVKFYNERRRQANAAQPNAAHLALKDLEQLYDVHIITQNVDDLHEQHSYPSSIKAALYRNNSRFSAWQQGARWFSLPS
jgi:NAD-dependent deacetylase